MRLRLASAWLVSIALVAGCSSDGDVRPEADKTRSGSSPSAAALTEARTGPLATYYGQHLRWSRCHRDFQCTRLEVPLDYARPAGRTIELAVVRLRRSGDGPRRSLVLNPGGPGGSGVDYALAAESVVSGDVRRAYDVVGFDPRGVQRSAPVQCLSDRALDEFVAVDGSPDDAAEEATWQRLSAGFGAGCHDLRPAMTAHISTIEAVRDMDILRAALGHRRLTFLGKSYGTQLGAVYAQRWPRRVGRLVLDGVLDPSVSAAGVAEGQTLGFQRALQSFLRDCVRRSSCPLDGDAAAAGAELARLVDGTDSQALRGEDSRPVTQAVAIYGIASLLYYRGDWVLLRQAIREMHRGNGATLQSVTDLYTDRGPSGRYTTNGLEAFYAITCLDRAETRDVAAQREHAAQLDAESPIFGAFLGWGNLPCSEWPVPEAGGLGTVTARGAPPILVVGTTRDPATPYEWARHVARTLDSGRLLTYVGDGHTAYRLGSGCVDKAVDRYLLEGKLPAAGTRCR